ncbi:MAG: YhcH/YjgK/YiaL family protein [Ferruginibacter sp.]
MIVSNNIENLMQYISDPIVAQDIIHEMLHPTETGYVNNKKQIGQSGITAIWIVAHNNDANPKMEIHRKFYDIHFTIEGEDCIAEKKLAECTQAVNEFQEDADYQHFSDTPTSSVKVPQGHYCIIDNDTAHAALYCTETDVKKIVFKVPAV